MNCPECQRPVYSRQHGTCGYCGAPLPPEMRLSPEEKAALQSEMEAIKARMAVAREREQEEAEERAKRHRDSHWGGF
ncbi:hypothetical protein llg_02100 [Luteolibacter sp. LG18]|nr:hypothetical protein llg_02100 [Luteolibacter sp. LG18]